MNIRGNPYHKLTAIFPAGNRFRDITQARILIIVFRPGYPDGKGEEGIWRGAEGMAGGNALP
jgi:hypothetical protein